METKQTAILKKHKKVYCQISKKIRMLLISGIIALSLAIPLTKQHKRYQIHPKASENFNFKDLTDTNIFSKTGSNISLLEIDNTTLIGYWPMDNDLIDQTGLSANGTNHGSVFSTDAKIGSHSVYFAGDDYISLGNPSSLNPADEISIALWVKIPSAIPSNRYPRLFCKNADSNPWGGYDLLMHGGILNGTFHAQAWSTSLSTWKAVSGTVTPQINTWYYVVYTIDITEGMQRLYVDGTLQEEDVTPSSLNTISNNVHLGASSRLEYTDYLTGYIDDVKVYSRELTQPEIEMEYLSIISPSAFTTDLSGHENIYAGKTLDITSKYSDPDGATNLDKLYLKIQNPGGTDIEYYASEGDDDNGLTPTAVSGSDYVSAITYDRDSESPDSESITITWHITFDWDWTQNSNVEFGVKAFDDDTNGSIYDYTNNDYIYENRLNFTGDLTATADSQGSLSSGDWVAASEDITWNGAKVVYQGTTTEYPSDDDFDVQITDDDTGSWTDTTSSGEAFSITSTADDSTDTEDIHNINIINIPTGGSDNSNLTFTIKSDASNPDIVDITGNNEDSWQNSSDSVTLSWSDPNSPSSDTFYITIDGSNPTSSNYDYSTTNSNYEVTSLNEGITTIIIRAVNSVGIEGSMYSFIFRYDATNPSIDSLISTSHPNSTIWYTDQTPDFTWTTTDTQSGIESVWRILDQTETRDSTYIITNGSTDSEDDSWTSPEQNSGMWYLHLAARDSTGNTINQSLKIQIDSTVPNIIEVTGANNNVWQNLNDSPTISWTDPSSLSDDTYYITNDGSNPTDSNYDYSTTSNTYDLPTQGEGSTTIYIRPLNGAGTYGNAIPFTIKFDETNPEITTLTSSTHPNESNTYSNNQPQISWEATDSISNIDSTFRLLDQTEIHTASYVIDNGVEDTTDNNWTSESLENGTWYFHLVGVDSADNNIYDSYTIRVMVTTPTTTTTTSTTSTTTTNPTTTLQPTTTTTTTPQTTSTTLNSNPTTTSIRPTSTTIAAQQESSTTTSSTSTTSTTFDSPTTSTSTTLRIEATREPLKILVTERRNDSLLSENSEAMHVFSGEEVIISIPNNVLTEELDDDIMIESVVFKIGNETYNLKLDKDGNYTSTLALPNNINEKNGEVLAAYSNGSIESFDLNINIDPYGYIYSIVDGNQLKINNAEVSLYYKEGMEEQLWIDSTGEYSNPQNTNEQGEYSYAVEPGNYKIKVEAKGYKNYDGDWFEVKDRTINLNIELEKSPNLIIIVIITTAITGSLIGIIMFLNRKKQT